MMGGYKFLVCYLGLVGLLPAVAANWKESLGKAYFLPDEDIYISQLKPGGLSSRNYQNRAFVRKQSLKLIDKVLILQTPGPFMTQFLRLWHIHQPERNVYNGFYTWYQN